jgi:selenocysteine lyase/cysteine desulfurase
LQKNNFESLIQQKKDLGIFLGNELKNMKLLDPEVEKRKDHSSIYNIIGDITLHDKLQKRGVRCSLRGKGVRVSVHFYNEKYEVENLIKILKKLN